MINPQSLITEFNSTLWDFVCNISSIFPDSYICQKKQYIKPIIDSSDSNINKKIMEIFIYKVLPFKSKIDDGDESFFLNHSFEKETNGDKSIDNKIFEFKQLWTQLNDINKQCVIEYMKTLCAISEEYFCLIVESHK